ncbi:hypothetical protein [Streptomyces sp. NBC_01483]|uniref:hypothetical protein n=1 Tax=Streptomyces sp. NBC_01483 TaxID=2903883 RepID=UPI002E34FBBE|nr:hypothetical protein [Streptomyces sp. NBC_01483]
MDGAAFIIIILAIAGVASALLFALKGILDQLPDVFDSARRAGDAWKRLKERPDEVDEPDEPPLPVTGPEDDEESPATA